MTPMTSSLQTAGWALIHFVWQGVAIAAAASVLLRLTRRRAARTRYVIACASLAAMLAAPIVTARLMWSTAPADGAVLTRGATSRLAPALTTVVDDRTALVQGAVVTRAFSPAVERLLPGITIAWPIRVGALMLTIVELSRMPDRSDP